MFKKAFTNATKYLASTATEHKAAHFAQTEAAERQVYLHLLYHPENPPASAIQRLWREFIALPAGAKPLNKLENLDGEEIPIDQLIIANHRAPNLGNLFSYRKICQRSGPKVSSRL